MTAFATYLESLTVAAKAANVAELQHQKDAAARSGELRAQREFAWRRLNLIRNVAAAVRGIEDEEAAAAAGRAAMLRDVRWNGATQAQRDVADRFAPVAVGIWHAAREETGADPAAALSDFEVWFATERGVPFLGLMDREIVELPLVEV